jgi:transcription elongation factor Elf1
MDQKISMMPTTAVCPFCGCADLVFYLQDWKYFVQCKRCAARGPASPLYHSAKVGWGSRCTINFDATIEGYDHDYKEP